YAQPHEDDRPAPPGTSAGCGGQQVVNSAQEVRPVAAPGAAADGPSESKQIYPGRAACRRTMLFGLQEARMANRRISIDYDFRPDEPSPDHASQIREAFAQLGWTVTYYGGGTSNVHRGFLDIESSDRQLDHPTLIATLKRLGIPLTGNAFTHTGISGDVSMDRRSVEWAHGREADIDDVHVEILDVTSRDPFQWQDRLVPQLGVRCIVSPRG